jgi:predicted RNA-binding protein with RPS1 domain
MSHKEEVETDIELLEQQDKLDHNSKIQLTESDKKAGTKVFSNAHYAQDLYNTIVNKTSNFDVKDLELNTIYFLYPKKYDFKDKLIHCEEYKTGMPVYIPASQYDGNILHISDLIKENKCFSSFVYKKDEQGNYIASNTKYKNLQYKQELWQKYHNGETVYVKLTELVKGGYTALYKNNVVCFLPGSHVEANVPLNFEQHVGKEIPVGIANYDSSNDLYFVSYKEYIKLTIHNFIKTLKFDQPYTGYLTSKPLNFGIFLEIEGYFTGLLYNTEFRDYNYVKNNYRPGDAVQVYIRNVFKDKKGNYKITLTLDQDNIEERKSKWQQFKNSVEGGKYEFEIEGSNSINIYFDENPMTLKQISRKYINKLKKANYVYIEEVDAIHENINFQPIK